jgi:hypothetical protein
VPRTACCRPLAATVAIAASIIDALPRTDAASMSLALLSASAKRMHHIDAAQPATNARGCLNAKTAQRIEAVAPAQSVFSGTIEIHA